jgi:hypothetical protein
VSKANLLAQHLRSCAWWRLDTAGASAIRVARSVVALLDTAAFLRDVPDNDPAIRALSDAGCFATGAFDPGERGAALIRGWQLADKPTAGPRDLLAALAGAAIPESAASKVPAARKAPESRRQQDRVKKASVKEAFSPQ